jgi:branched-chain amino acid aminotransferase
MAGTVYVSGEYRQDGEATVSVFDHGLLYGDGVFEGIRAYNGRVFKLDRHLDRLYDSARALRIEIPVTRAALEAIVVETCRRNDIVDGYIRLVITRGRGDLGINPRSCGRAEVIVIARPQLALYTETSRGVTMVTSSFRRNAPDATSPSIKSLNYVNNVLARMEANDRNADEALMLDAGGYVAEASADNIFIVTDRGTLVTPPTATNLNGITRETVLEIAAELGIATEVRLFNLFEVWSAREVLICGTGAEVVPVVTVDNRTIGSGAIGPVTERLMTAYARVVRSTGTPIAAPAAAMEGVRPVGRV